MRIRAAVAEKEFAPFVFHELELEEPRDDEVLVKVVATGVCQTDLHVRDRYYEVPLPAVLGHEGAGVVERVGRDVRDVEAGDHVVLTFQSCGSCGRCLDERYAYCERGFEANFGGARLDGSRGLSWGGEAPQAAEIHGHFFGQSAFATHALATERNTVKVRPDVPLELLGPLGCGVQTGAGAVLNALEIESGASLVILGTGSVGLAAVMAARVAGADPIIGVDINAARIALASELGATHTIDAREHDVRARITEIAPGGVDYVLEVTGVPQMVALAVELLAPLGTAGLIGSAPVGTEASIDMNTLQAGRTARGILQGDSVPGRFIRTLIDLYRSGDFPFDRIVRYYDFEDINRAVADMESGTTIKPVLRVGEASR